MIWIMRGVIIAMMWASRKLKVRDGDENDAAIGLGCCYVSAFCG